MDFLRCTHLTLGQLSPNVIRIIGGIDALNRIHGTDLGLDELKFWYSLNKGSYSYNFGARNDAPSLVFAIPDSHKEVIIVIEEIESNPTNKLVPRRTLGPGRCI